MPSSTVVEANTDKTSHTILSVLERTVLIDTVKWDGNSVVMPVQMTRTTYETDKPQYIAQYDFPKAILDASPPMISKLADFAFLKSDLEIEIKVNAQKFMQGALMVVYNPYVKNINKFRGRGAEFMPSITTLPHKILDLASGNAVKIVVPYANEYDMFDLFDEFNQFGTIRIYSISPLRAGTDNQMTTFTVIARLVNPEFTTPTRRDPREALSGADLLSTCSDVQKKQISKILGEKHQQARLTDVVAQISEGAHAGPIETLTGTISTVAEGLSSVPVIGELATPVSWVARAASKVAAVFGLSKPIDTLMPSQVINTPAKTLANVEGKDFSVSLSLLPDTAVDASKTIPENVDEMALGYIFNRPNYINRFTVSSSDFTAGNKLFQWNISPFQSSMIDNFDGQSLHLGSFAYTSMLAQYWRGTINYNLRVIKTKYHEGRFVVVFFPRLMEAPDILSQELTKCYNIICDLQPKSESDEPVAYPVVVPYVSNVPWKETFHEASGIPQANTLQTATGCVGVYALTTMVFPDLASDTIDFLLEVCGGPDYQVAVPHQQLTGGFAPSEPGDDINAWVIEHLTNRDWETREDAVEGTSMHAFYDIGNASVRMSKLSIGGVPQPGYDISGFMGVPTSFSPGFISTTVLNSKFSSESAVWPDTVAATYTLQISRSGRILAFTFNGEFISAIDAGPQTDMSLQIEVPRRARKCSMEIQSNESMVTDALLLGGTSSSDPRASTIGEYFESLRAYMKRFHPVYALRSGPPVTFSPMGFSNAEVTENPGRRQMMRKGTRFSFLRESPLNLVSYLFRFYSGGFRFKIISRCESNNIAALAIMSNPESTLVSTTENPVFETLSNVNNACEVTVPFYSPIRCRAIGAAWSEPGACVTTHTNFVGSDQPNSSDGTNGENHDYASRIYEAASDDTTFFYLVGPPVMHASTLTPTDLLVVNGDEPAFVPVMPAY